MQGVCLICSLMILVAEPVFEIQVGAGALT